MYLIIENMMNTNKQQFRPPIKIKQQIKKLPKKQQNQIKQKVKNYIRQHPTKTPTITQWRKWIRTTTSNNLIKVSMN